MYFKDLIRLAPYFVHLVPKLTGILSALAIFTDILSTAIILLDSTLSVVTLYVNYLDVHVTFIIDIINTLILYSYIVGKSVF